jgi:benzoylformate decarboxylase
MRSRCICTATTGQHFRSRLLDHGSTDVSNRLTYRGKKLAKTGDKNMQTVRDVTYQLFRELGLTTVFGNVGSTEETFLKNFPKDFRYVLAPQEASVIAIADGFAQATRRPVLVNLHTTATANGMGNLATAFQNKTPLIVTAGQQTREMLLMEPWLTDVEPTMLPRPWVKLGA